MVSFSTEQTLIRRARTIHEHRLRNIICIVPGHDVVDIKHGGPAIERLPSEDTAEGTVVLLADLRDNAVHSPSIELIVG